MRSPSSRCAATKADLYVGVSTQADGGFQQLYPTTPTASQVPCSIRCVESIEDFDDQKRLTIRNTYRIVFVAPTNLTPRDKVTWLDRTANVTHTAYVSALPSSGADRQASYVVTAVERL